MLRQPGIVGFRDRSRPASQVRYPRCGVKLLSLVKKKYHGRLVASELRCKKKRGGGETEEAGDRTAS